MPSLSFSSHGMLRCTGILPLFFLRLVLVVVAVVVLVLFVVEVLPCASDDDDACSSLPLSTRSILIDLEDEVLFSCEVWWSGLLMWSRTWCCEEEEDESSLLLVLKRSMRDFPTSFLSWSCIDIEHIVWTWLAGCCRYGVIWYVYVLWYSCVGVLLLQAACFCCMSPIVSPSCYLLVVVSCS